MTEEYLVHTWVERAQSATVEAESVEEAREAGREQVADDLRELGVPVDEFRITVDEIIQDW